MEFDYIVRPCDTLVNQAAICASFASTCSSTAPISSKFAAATARRTEISETTAKELGVASDEEVI
jgi:hypothetical protein